MARKSAPAGKAHVVRQPPNALAAAAAGQPAASMGVPSAPSMGVPSAPSMGVPSAPSMAVPSAEDAPPVESPQEDKPPLAPLRQDVRLYPGPRNRHGAPSHVLHDPAGESYFHIGAVEFEILARWDLGDRQQIASEICEHTTFIAAATDVEELEQQLQKSGLLRAAAKDIIAVKEELDKKQPHLVNRLVNEMLFKRMPLLHPQKFLDRTLFMVSPLFNRSFWLILFAGFLVSFYLITRQWDLFVTSLYNMVNLSGAFTISVALVIAKSMHELAHGYAARRYGADVPVMGVALILFWPLLYTETSHAWTLPRRRQRIIIACAGVAVELALAMGCFILWPFLEPGALRDAAGFAATTLILLSLAFNANPLMKFDGYFVLTELFGIENMQPRGFEVLKWHLRKLVAGARLSYPELALNRKDRRILLGYGVASAIYRIFLYSGIVYALNLMLFPAIAYPISVLIIMSSLFKPVLGEFAIWLRLAWRAKGWLGLARIACVMALLAAPLFIPWRSTVQIAVVIGAGEAHDVFANEPARIVKINAAYGRQVHKGDVVFELAAPELDNELSRIRLKASNLDQSIARQLTGISYHQGVKIAENELAQLRAQVAGLTARQRKLTVLAPADGRITSIDRMLRTGVWVRADRPLLQIVSVIKPTIRGYAEERDIGFIKPGAALQLVIDGRPNEKIFGTVRAIFPKALAVLDEPMMGVPAGGSLEVRPFRNKLVPAMAVYKVDILLNRNERQKLPMIQTRGVAIIDTAPRNLVGRITDRLVGMWRRELG